MHMFIAWIETALTRNWKLKPANEGYNPKSVSKNSGIHSKPSRKSTQRSGLPGEKKEKLSKSLTDNTHFTKKNYCEVIFCEYSSFCCCNCYCPSAVESVVQYFIVAVSKIVQTKRVIKYWRWKRQTGEQHKKKSFNFCLQLASDAWN